MFKLIVRGRGEFPLDMLRHDQCWPATAQDVAAITPRYGLADQHRDALHARDVALYTAKPWPTARRWESFDWFVMSNNDEAIKQ